jgi:MoaA/NifB/PqqE/SkfB family radical SAM enzyme/2-polyprenyl-3-methyl-5-hydroxy-6-metoxy-1,4-benzoquinol methylase
MPSRYHQPVDPNRPNDTHAFQLALVGWNRRVLELGAASGHVTRALVDRRCTVTSIEFEASAAKDLKGIAHEVIVGDLNDPNVFDTLKPEYDIVLAGDVLEHVLRPHDVLCGAVRLLRPGGQVVISLPHVGHIDVRLSLMRGQWNYRPWGLLDATHIRFFTLETIKQMLDEAGLTLTELRRVRVPAFETELGVERSTVASDLLERLLADPEAETYQFVLAAAVDDGTRRLAQLAERNSELEIALGRSSLGYGAISAERDATAEELARSREELAAAAARLEVAAAQLEELGALRGQAHDLQAQLSTAQRSLSRIDGSVSWQAFQRLRTASFAAAGGERSLPVRALQAVLRLIGRSLGLGASTRGTAIGEPGTPPAGPSPRQSAPLSASDVRPEPPPAAGEPAAVALPAIANPEATQHRAAAAAAAPSSSTACVIPWTNFVVRPDGYTAFCCDVPGLLTVGDRPGNVVQDSLDDLWNAPELVSTRQAMARGERPEGCAVCWKREAQGTISRRLHMNDVYRRGGGLLDVDALPLVGADSDYRLERRPDWFILELGNTCNLKCRSCSPAFSSRIAGDAVHAAWAPDAEGGQSAAAPKDQRLDGATGWFRDITATADMVASGASENAFLSLIGGEPFIIKQTWQLLQELSQRGVAEKIYVGLLTNGQWRSSKLAELAPHFRGMNVSVSIDGHGALYEYLRHGASWEKLLGTLDWLTGLEGVAVAATPTLQNANALYMVPLLRMLDGYGLPVTYNTVTWPARLQATNLPPNVRRLAVQRLRSYLESECREGNAGVVRGYCELLEEPGDEFDEELFREFMTFTNDLDASRGERLADAAPELFELIAASGIEWSEEHRHHPPTDEVARITSNPSSERGD